MFLSVQTRMLTTLKAFQITLKPRQEPEPHSREGSSSQEGSSTNRDSRYRRPEPLKTLTSQDSEEEDEEADSDRSLTEEGEDVEDSQEEDSRPGRHIFSADDMERLLWVVHALEAIQELAAQVSAQDRMHRGLVRPQSKVLPIHQSLKDIILRGAREKTLEI